MAIVKETQVFVDWLSDTVGGRWFAYDRVDLAHHAFLVESETNDGNHVWYVWGHEQATIHSNRENALKRFNRLIAEDPA